jgi:Cu+-exporting ATPase
MVEDMPVNSSSSIDPKKTSSGEGTSRAYQLRVEGMHCSSCELSIERALEGIPGLKQYRVNSTIEQVHLEFDDQCNPGNQVHEIRRKLSASGYPVVSVSRGSGFDVNTMRCSRIVSSRRRRKEAHRWLRYFVEGMVLGLPIAFVELLPGDWTRSIPGAKWISLVLASLGMIRLAPPYYREAMRSVRNRSTNMDVLVSIGSTAAYIFSCMILAGNLMSYPGTSGMHLHFHEGIMILSIISLGKYLEARVRNRMGRAIEGLYAMTARHATVLRDGETIRVRMEDLQPGWSVQIKPGERIPVDGEIIEGHALVNESIVTGESVPREKQVGDGVRVQPRISTVLSLSG